MRRHKDGQGPAVCVLYTMSTRSPPLVSPERDLDPNGMERLVLLLSLWRNAFTELFAFIRLFLLSLIRPVLSARATNEHVKRFETGDVRVRYRTSSFASVVFGALI